jgi:hypothetical protein
MHCRHESKDKLFTRLIIRIEISNFSKIRTWIQKFRLKSEISTVTSEFFNQQFSTHNMIKNSESASIAHFEHWNSRRESLLSRNRIEEDMNVLLKETELKNMNTLSFNYKMTRISINTELNVWITAHDADNIVVFIQHICHKHDIEIETHNDLIQMLNNVNKINISLKTQLRTQQTSLQEEIKDKNLIICYLKFSAWSRLNLLIFEDWFSKSTKLSDLILFEDSLQNVNNWLSRMQNKLKINKNYFSIKELKIVYIESWVSEAAIKHITSWMKDTSLNLFLEAEEVLLIINKMYNDFNHHHITQW